MERTLAWLKQHLELIKLILGVVTAVLGTVTAAVQFLKLWRGDQSTVTWVTAALGWLALALVSGYVAWRRVPGRIDPKRRIPAYPRWRRLALAVLVLLLLAPAIAGYALYRHDQALRSKVVILVADFTGPEPEQYRVTEQILVQLREALAGYDDTVVVALGRPIMEQEGSPAAREEGRRRRADLVLWGWYARTESDVRVTVHVENLSSSKYLTLRGEEPYQMQAAVAELESFQLQDRLSGEMSALMLFVSGLARYEAVDYREAIRRFTDALAPGVWPEGMVGPEMLHSYRGTAYFYQGEYKRAIADYDEMLRLNPQDAEAHNNRALAYAYLGEYKRAIEDFIEALRLNPQSAEVYNNRGVANADLGEYERAIADYDKALRLNPQLAEAYNNRGLAYTGLGEYERAIADYDEALRLNPQYAKAYTGRGAAYDSLGKHERAIADYGEALRFNPQDAAAYNNRGLAYTGLGEYERAFADHNEALRLNPQDAAA